MAKALDVIAVGVLALVLYLPNLSRHYDLDGVAEALALEDGFIFTPNHLLYRAVGYTTHSFLGAWGYHGASLWTLRALSAVFGAMGIALTFLAFKRLTGHQILSAAGSLWLATTPVYWGSSTDAGYVTLASLFIAASLVCIFGPPTKLRMVSCGSCSGLAILAWQGNVFFVPGVLLGLFILHRKMGLKAIAVRSIFVLAPLAILVAAGFGAAGFSLGHTTIRGLLQWASGHVGGALPLWGKFELNRVVILGYSFVRSIVTGQSGVFPLLPARLSMILIAVMSAVILAIQWRKTSAMRAEILVLAVSFCLYVPFLVWWDPWATKWFVVVNVFLAGIIVRIWSRHVSRKPLMAGLVAAVCLNALTVFVEEVHPRHATASAAVATAECVARHMTDKDLFLATDWYWADYLRYFHQRKVTSFLSKAADLGDKQKVFRAVNDVAGKTQQEGGTVYMIDFQSYSPEHIQWLESQTGITAEEFAQFGSVPAFDCESKRLRKLLPLK